MDKAQGVFEAFEVPDPVRINKALDFINKKYSSLDNLNILECGISKGGLVDKVKNSGANCFGVDINPRNFKDVNVKQADLNDGLPDFGEKFDIVFAGEVIEHIFNDRQFLRSCFESIKPGGRLIITTPNLNFIPNRLLVLFGKLPKFFVEAPYHYHIYNKKKLSNMITEAGFEVEDFKSSHVLFSTRRNKIGIIFEKIGDIIPSIGAHLMIFAKKPKDAKD